MMRFGLGVAMHDRGKATFRPTSQRAGLIGMTTFGVMGAPGLLSLGVSLRSGASKREIGPPLYDNGADAHTDGPLGCHVLFVCGKNRLRSPTAEQVFADWPGVETASAGTGHDADCPVSAELLDWADVVLVMEAAHRTKIAARSPPQLRGKRLAVLGIPDVYDYTAPGLVQRLLERVPRYLPGRDNGD